MASGRGFHPLAGQQQHAGFDLLELAFLDRRQRRKWLGALACPALLTHLHAQHASIHTQHHRWRSLPCGGPSLRLSAWYWLNHSLWPAADSPNRWTTFQTL